MPPKFLKKFIRFFFIFTTVPNFVYAQKNIVLPYELREEIKPQLSGMTWHENRLYMVPQYLASPGRVLSGDLYVYSFSADSIGRVVDGIDTALSTLTAVRIINANKLPKVIHEHYGGFEAIAINGNRVYFTIESNGTWADNYVVCGTLNSQKNEIRLHPKSIVTLKRFDTTDNAGFESLLYNTRSKRLTAIYEFNATAQTNFAYEISRKMRSPKQISVPFSYFRLTDIILSNDTLFALNQYWGGDYSTYLKNYFPERIADSVPELKETLAGNPSFLEDRGKSFTKVVYLDPQTRNQWKTAVIVKNEGSENNWEGLVRFRDGFLVLSDSNLRGPLVTTLRYVPYKR